MSKFKPTIYRTVIQFEILSDTSIEMMSLDEIAYEVKQGGMSGRFLDDVVTNEELKGMKAVKVIKAHGSDPEFFNLDKKGYELEY